MLPSCLVRSAFGRPSRRRPRRRRALFLLFLFISAVQAVQIQFSNCLQHPAASSTAYFAPSSVDADYNDGTIPGRAILTFTVSGNMTGSLVNLNPVTNTYATLRSQLNVVNSLLFNDYSRLCENTVDGVCPFGPGAAAFSYSFNVSKAYQGVPFNTRFVIINSVETENIVGCIEAQVTPIIARYAYFVMVFIIVGIAVFIAASFVVTAYLNPWTGTTNIYSWASTLNRDVNVVRLVTPGLFDFMNYFQFAFFLSCLSLDYPSFLQPVVSTISWVVLMFRISFVSHGTGELIDGVYSTSGPYGLQHMSQIVRQKHVKDIWATFTVWLLVLTAGVLAIGQLASLITWAWRKYKSDNYDLRSRAGSFALGLVLRIIFRVFALPLLVFCFFQCVVTGLKDSNNVTVPVYLTVIAALVLVAWVVSAVAISYYLWQHASRPTIFDNFSTLLKFGTLYNTYTEHAAMFFTVDFAANFLRALTIGAIQTSGLAQITLLAVIELAYLFSLMIVRPYDPETNMNLVSSIITAVRFVLVMLTLPFIPSTGVSPESRQWLGYVILILHALAILLFFVRAAQVIAEVVTRYTGAGLDTKRGGAIYNLKQLSRRRQRPRSAGAQSAPTVTSRNAPIDTELGMRERDSSTSLTKSNTRMMGLGIRSVTAGSSAEGEYKDNPGSAGNEGVIGNDDDDVLYAARRLQEGTAGKSRGYTMLTPQLDNFDDVYISSPTSDISSFDVPNHHRTQSITSRQSNEPTLRNSIIPVGSASAALGRSNTAGKRPVPTVHRGDSGYYRKPRRRGSSFDWSSPAYLKSTLENEGGNNDYDDNALASPTSPKPTSTGHNEDDPGKIRMGLVSPPPAGVDYAVREADIYYRQQAEHRKQSRKHKHKHKHKKTEDGEEGSKRKRKHAHRRRRADDDNTVINTPNLDKELSAASPKDNLLDDYDEYEGATGMMSMMLSEGNRKHKHTYTNSTAITDASDSKKLLDTPPPLPTSHSHSNSTDLETLATRVGNGGSAASTPGRISMVWQGDDSVETTPGTPNDEFGESALRGSIVGEGILQNRNLCSGAPNSAGRRSRNLNSLIGLLEQDEGEETYYNSNGKRKTKKNLKRKSSVYGAEFGSVALRDPSGSQNVEGGNGSVSTIKLAQTTASKTAAVAGWVSRVVRRGVQTVQQKTGRGAVSNDDDLLQPKGFEVIRRGPIRPYKSSTNGSEEYTESTSESSMENSEESDSYSDSETDSTKSESDFSSDDSRDNYGRPRPQNMFTGGNNLNTDNEKGKGKSRTPNQGVTSSNIYSGGSSSAGNFEHNYGEPGAMRLVVVGGPAEDNASILSSKGNISHSSATPPVASRAALQSLPSALSSYSPLKGPSSSDPQPPKLTPISPARPRPMPIPVSSQSAFSNSPETLLKAPLRPSLSVIAPNSISIASSAGENTDESTASFRAERGSEENARLSMQTHKGLGVPVPQAVRTSPHVMEVSVTPEVDSSSASSSSSKYSSASNSITSLALSQNRSQQNPITVMRLAETTRRLQPLNNTNNNDEVRAGDFVFPRRSVVSAETISPLRSPMTSPHVNQQSYFDSPHGFGSAVTTPVVGEDWAEGTISPVYNQDINEARIQEQFRRSHQHTRTSSSVTSSPLPLQNYAYLNQVSQPLLGDKSRSATASSREEIRRVFDDNNERYLDLEEEK